MRGMAWCSAALLGLAGILSPGYSAAAQQKEQAEVVPLEVDFSDTDLAARERCKEDGDQKRRNAFRIIEPPVRLPELDRAYPLLKIGEIVGMGIRDTRGKALGQVEELIIDPRSGRIRYVALSSDGFLGETDKLAAVPWQVLRLGREKQEQEDRGEYVFTLPLEKELLKKAPTFDRDEWPSLAEERWSREIDQFYNQQLRRTGRRDGSLQR